MRPERRGRVVQPSAQVNRQREEPVGKAKPHRISKQQVYEAYLRVKANRGAAGIDNLDHEMTMKAVRHHTDEKWVVL
jgi:hypothetical protein